MKSISKKWATFSVILLAVTTLLFQLQINDNTNLSLWGKFLLIFVAFFLLAHTREEKERWKTGFHLFGYCFFLIMVILIQTFTAMDQGFDMADSMQRSLIEKYNLTEENPIKNSIASSTFSYEFNESHLIQGSFEVLFYLLPIILFWMFSFLIRDNWSEKILANIHHHRKIALLVFVISFLLFIFLLAVEKRYYVAFIFWLFMIGATGVEYIIRVSQHHKNQKTLEHFVEKK